MHIRKKTTDVDKLSNLGLKHLKKGELDKAILYFEYIIKLDPENADAYFKLGLLYDDKGETKKAISFYKKVIALDPSDASTYYNLGLVYSENRELDQAINYLEKALTFKPEDIEIITTLAEVREEYEIRKQTIKETKVSLNHILKNYRKISLDVLAKMLNFESIFELQQFIVNLPGEKPFYLEGNDLVVKKDKLKGKIEIKKIKSCFYCGQPLESGDIRCSSCNKETVKCSVCKLPITFGEMAGKCSLCESISHMNHFQEWIKTQGKCPTCLQKLPLDGIVPISEEIKK